MKRKVVIFRGSPREHGNTNSLTDVVAEELRASGCRVTDWNLQLLEIRPCLACRECQKDWEAVTCVQRDDFGDCTKSIAASDLILIATPIYSWYCTPPVKALLDRMVYAFNMYYGDRRGPSLWKGKSAALITTCVYPPEKGADLFEEGFRRYCKHSQLRYQGMLCEHHQGYGIVFMDERKKQHAEQFAEMLLERL